MELILFQECLAHEIHRKLTKARNNGDIVATLNLTPNEWVQVQEECAQTPLIQQADTSQGQSWMLFAGVPVQVDGELVKGSGILLPGQAH